jgi:hypothetical protein
VGFLARFFTRFRRTPRLTVFDEEDAYARLHGHRSGEISVSPAPPPSPRVLPRFPGDYLRRCFEERLDGRRAKSSSGDGAEQAGEPEAFLQDLSLPKPLESGARSPSGREAGIPS